MKPVILAVILLITYVLCDDLNPNDNSNVTETSKNKRGILGYHGYGHGLHYSIPSTPHFHSTAHHVSPYAARFPAIFKNFNYPNGYALSHGGASVTSYNINYPKYSFYSPKPHYHIPVHSPLPRPLIPTPPVVLAQKPIVPVAPIPTFASKPFIPIGVPTFSNRFPIIVSKPIPVPFRPGLAASGVLPFGVQPQFVPYPIQPTINSFPAVGTPEPIPLPGTTFVNNVQPDPWHPILVNQQPSPTIATTPHVHRPAVNLLPPYGQTDASHQAQLELQQDNYDGGYAEEQYAGRVSQLYLSPNPNSEKNQPLLQQRPQFTEQDIPQIGFDHQGQGRNVQFQYDPPSNNGQYSGPSSYEVELGSYTRAY